MASASSLYLIKTKRCIFFFTFIVMLNKSHGCVLISPMRRITLLNRGSVSYTCYSIRYPVCHIKNKIKDHQAIFFFDNDEHERQIEKLSVWERERICCVSVYTLYILVIFTSNCTLEQTLLENSLQSDALCYLFRNLTHKPEANALLMSNFKANCPQWLQL